MYFLICQTGDGNAVWASVGRIRHSHALPMGVKLDTALFNDSLAIYVSFYC